MSCFNEEYEGGSGLLYGGTGDEVNITNVWSYGSTHTHPASATSGVPWISQALVVGVVPTDRAYPLLIASCCTFYHFQGVAFFFDLLHCTLR